MKIASWNVNSVKVRMPHLLDFLKSAQPDVLCLQEIKCLADDFPRLEVQALGYRVDCIGQRAYNGVALVSKEPPRDIVTGLPGFADEQARYIEASFSGATGEDVRVGSLYLPAKQSDAAAILAADTPRQMVMQFVFSVGKDKIAEAWDEGLEDNTPNASAEVKTAFKTLASWMEDIKDGQSIVLTYLPSIGTTVEVNGKVKGTLPGKAVSDAILNTWIGPKPGPGDDFKNGILGK